MPAAAYCCWAPSPTLMLAGVIAIEVSVGAVIVLTFEVIEPDTAVMEVGAGLSANSVASPALVMLAVAGLADTHVTDEVIVAVVPLLYVPIAAYCWVALRERITLAGVIAIEVNTGGTVIKLAFEVTVP